MSKDFELFVALRYLRAKRKQAVISVITIISILGVAAGVMALVIALGINNVLDEDPPPCRACDLNNYDGTIYPVPGRYIHARAAIKF